MPTTIALIAAIAMLLPAHDGRAQSCSEQWLPGNTSLSPNGGVAAMTMWDPDGPGPRLPVVVIGGAFTAAGGLAANGIAAWDPTTEAWTSLGTGVGGIYDPTIEALAVMTNGDLVAAGNFTTAGGKAALNIARWNGASWSPLGSGVLGGIWALAVLPNGDVVAGGTFSILGGSTANNVIRWDGHTWSSMGTGVNGYVLALAVMPNGDLVAGGRFSTAGGISANRISRWNGSAWSAMGSGMDYVGVYALDVLPNGDLLAAGDFSNAGGVLVHDIARWDGAAWSAIGSGTGGRVFSVSHLPNGNLLAGGQFLAVGANPKFIQRWNGSSWSDLGSNVVSGPEGGISSVLGLSSGDTLAGGSFGIGGFALGTAPQNFAQLTQVTFPHFEQQPVARLACPDSSTDFSVTATGTRPHAFQWQLQTDPNGGDSGWKTLSADPAALPCGGTANALTTSIDSASRMFVDLKPCPGNPTQPQHFRIRCIVSNTCGSTVSNEATYTICPADFNCSGTLNVNDVFDFLYNWFSKSDGADFNRSGSISVQDLMDFLAAWFAGC